MHGSYAAISNGFVISALERQQERSVLTFSTAHTWHRQRHMRHSSPLAGPPLHPVALKKFSFAIQP